MKQSLLKVSRLFTGSLRYLFFLEILFKVIGGLILFPLCEMLLHLALRLTKIHYISEQNIKTVLTHPVLAAAMLLILLLLLGFLAFEMACLAISYQQAYYKQPIGLFQLIREGFLRSLKLIHPRHWFLFPVLVLLFPTMYFFIQNASSNTIRLINMLITKAFSRFPYSVAGLALILVLIVFALFGMFSFQHHIAQHARGFASVRQSFRIMRRRLGRILSRLIVWMLIVCGALLLLDLIVYGLIRLGTEIFVEESLRKAVRVTLFHYAGQVLNFISISFLTFAVFAFAASFYYEYCERTGLASSPLIRSKVPRARLRGSLTVGTLLLCIIVTVLFNYFMVRTIAADSLSNRFFSDKITIVSHRGYVEEYKENTLSALQAGIDARADCLEFDVQLTSDGVVALQHDKTLYRCWGIRKRLGEIHSSELSGITDRNGDHIPTLREVFELCQDQDVNLLIELKVNAYIKPDVLAAGVMELIEEYDMIDRCMLQSFSYHALKTAKSINEDIVCGYLMNGSVGMYSDLEYADFFSVNMNYVTESTVSTIHLRDKKLMIWTTNTEKRIDEAIRLGVDGIITDEPILAREKIYGDDLFLENVLVTEDEEESEEERPQ